MPRGKQPDMHGEGQDIWHDNEHDNEHDKLHVLVPDLDQFEFQLDTKAVDTSEDIKSVLEMVTHLVSRLGLRTLEFQFSKNNNTLK